jgi:hypothetical protein
MVSDSRREAAFDTEHCFLMQYHYDIVLIATTIYVLI